MARKRKPTGDDATNARKRFYRAAERKLKEAERAAGITAERLRYLAKQDLQDALNTYSKSTTQKFSKPIQALAAKLGVNLSDERQKIKQRSDKQAQKMREQAIRLDKESRSAKTLEGTISSIDVRREREARAILNSPIGKRILGGTVDIWRDEATSYKIDPVTGEPVAYIDKRKIFPTLFDYFQVDNLVDLIEAVENAIGNALYADEANEAMYETVKILLQSHIMSDNSVIS